MLQTKEGQVRYTDIEMRAMLITLFSPPQKDKYSRIARILRRKKEEKK